MLGRLTNQLRWSYRKNVPDLWALLTRNYPEFVTARNPGELRDEIPVFTFHSVAPDTFERQLQFLAQNGYRTLEGAEFRAAIAGESAIPPRSVLLTFDDGRASLWSVAFPLLQKYGFRAVSFIIPGLIPERAPATAVYQDYCEGRATVGEVLARERSDHPLCSWQEIRLMHESGVIDFQSHTMYHQQICVSPHLVDFLHPRYPVYFFGNLNVPAYYTGGKFDLARQQPWGTPIYRAEPRMAGRPAFYDNVELRTACSDYVVQQGGERFFHRPRWRRELFAFFRSARRKHDQLQFEKPADQHKSIRADLAESKSRIEQELPGKIVDQLCYPWFQGSPLVVRLSKAVGYQVNYWGVVPSRPTNCRQQSLFYVPRLEEHYLFRLPGEGRQGLREILQRKMDNHLPGFAVQLISS